MCGQTVHKSNSRNHRNHTDLQKVVLKSVGFLSLRDQNINNEMEKQFSAFFISRQSENVFSGKEYPCSIFKLADDKIAFSGTTDRKPRDAQRVTGCKQEITEINNTKLSTLFQLCFIGLAYCLESVLLIFWTYITMLLTYLEMPKNIEK